MSDTPRTTAALKRTQGMFRVASLGNGFTDYAEQLERELAASQAGQAKWQALAEGLAKRLNLWHNAAGNRCNVQDAAALAAYEVARKAASPLDEPPGPA